jgi:hypothetical protein
VDITCEIFKKLPEGPIWVETVIGLEQIKERLANLNKTNPGEYFAYDILEARIVAELPCDN